MIRTDDFKKWLKKNTQYSDEVIIDIASRMRRADTYYTWDGSEVYLFYLEKNAEFKQLSASVKSQIRRAVKLYFDFIKTIND